MSVSLVLCGCKHEQTALISEPVRPGAEPTSFGPAVIVEAPPQQVGCVAATPSGSGLLIPETAQWLVRIDPARVMNSAFWSLLGAPIETNDLSGVFAGLRECGIEPAGLEEILVGFETVDENFVFVMRGPGVGQGELATCALRAVHRRVLGDSEVEVRESPTPREFGGYTMIPFDDGAGYLLNPDELVLTTLGWQQQVAQLAQCMGRPALQSYSGSGLASLISRVDTRADVWAIGTLTPTMASFLAMLGLPTTGPLEAAVMADFGDGFGFDINLTLDSPASAETGRTALNTTLDQFAASGEPLFAELVTQMAVDASGPMLLVRGRISIEQLRMLADNN